MVLIEVLRETPFHMREELPLVLTGTVGNLFARQEQSKELVPLEKRGKLMKVGHT